MQQQKCKPDLDSFCDLQQAAIPPIYGSVLSDFINCWHSLNGQPVQTANITTAINYSKEHLRAMLKLKGLPIDQYFTLDMFVTKSKLKDSPIQLYNTRVDAKNCEHLYTDILRIISRCLPNATELLTYVREPRTLDMLEKNFTSFTTSKTCNNLPLVQLFESANWEFVNVAQVDSLDAYRRFPIRFRTVKAAISIEP